MPTVQLEDQLIEETASYHGFYPPLGIHKKGEIIPRIHPCTIRQRPYVTEEDNPFIESFEFIGTPVDESTLQQIRRKNGLSKNYGAVVLPKKLFGMMDPKSSKFVIGETGNNYIVAGLLPSRTLRGDARRVTSDEEHIIYTSISDFTSLDPKELMKRYEVEN